MINTVIRFWSRRKLWQNLGNIFELKLLFTENCEMLIKSLKLIRYGTDGFLGNPYNLSLMQLREKVLSERDQESLQKRRILYIRERIVTYKL